MRKLRKPKITPRLEIGELRTNQVLKEQLKIEIQNRYSVLENESETPDEWIIFRDAIVQGAEKVIPKKNSKVKQKWMTGEILEMLDQRRAAKQNSEEKYK